MKLPGLEAWNERRRQLAGRYRDELLGAELVLPVERPGTRHAWHLFVVRLRDRDAVRETLLAKGIEALVHYPRALHQHPGYASLAHAGLEQSETLAREVLSLPLSPQLSDAELEQVCVALDEVLR